MPASPQNLRPSSVMARPPNLPVIEHPSSRMGDRKMLNLNVMGSNRGDLVSAHRARRHVTSSEEFYAGGEAAEGKNFPLLRERKGSHSRTSTWPLAQDLKSGERRAKSAKVGDAIPKQRFSPEQLYNYIKERLTTGYHGFYQQFKANDPQGRESVSKGALARILFHLVGYVSLEEVTSLVEWLGLTNSEKISFDDFISHFRDNETVQRVWLSPVARKELRAERNIKPNPEAHLRQSFVKPGSSEYVEASYANALLKEMCKHSDFDLRKHLVSACFEPDGIVMKPQLQDCLASMGARLYDEDMWLLWSRYDKENVGAVKSSWFFERLGLDKNGRYVARSRKPPSSRQRRFLRTPCIPNIPESEQENKDPNNNRPDSSSSDRLPSPEPPKAAPSTDVISFLLRKMEQNFYSLLMSCEHFDSSGDGNIPKVQFKEILREYGIPMHPHDMENMLERCNLLKRDGLVNYKDFLFKFMSRNPNGIAHRIMMDPEHKFNTRMNTPQGLLSAGDAEAKIMELLHKDFLKLLGQFQNLDQHRLHLVTETQFRTTIDSVFGIRMTDRQFDELLCEVGTDCEGLVLYPEFLAIFNKRRLIPSSVTNPPARPPSELANRYSPVNPPVADSLPNANEELPIHKWLNQSPEDKAGEDKTHEKKNVMEGRYKPVSEMCDMIEDIIKYKSHETKYAYEKIDRKHTGRLTRTQLHYWLQELGVMLHPTELQELWRNMAIGRDGLIHYAEMIDYFLNKSRRKPITDKMKVMQNAKATFNQPVGYTENFDQNMESSTPRDLYMSPSENVVEKIRPQVVKNWEELKRLLKDLDPEGYGTISATEFKNLCHYIRAGLGPKELNMLCSQFDFNLNNQFHYLQFMQLFAQLQATPPRKRLPASSNKYNRNFHRITYHNSSGIQETSVADILSKIKKQLLNDWKYLRRAFKKADLNQDGVLSIPEFKQCIKDMHIKINEEDLYHVISELDKNMDGFITYDEFLGHFA